MNPIRAPRWSCPAFAAPGDPLAVVTDGGETEACFHLEKDGGALRLRVDGAEHLPAYAVTRHSLRIPDSAGDGLYDLVLHGDSSAPARQRDDREGRQTMPRAVALRSIPPETVRLAYTGDWHLLTNSAPGEFVDQSSRLFSLVDHLNDLAVDAVVHVGDVITRYQLPDKAPLPEERIRWQVVRAREIFDRLQMPVFVLPGNHDVAFDSCRRAWWEVVGRPWDSATDDSSRTLGPVHMIQLDGFVHYDPQTLEKTQQSLKPEQISWLEETLARSDARWRILAYHYDYSRQVLANLADMGVDAFFYGHSKTHDSRYFENGARNGHLPGDSAYRLVEATAESLQLGLAVSFAELGVEE